MVVLTFESVDKILKCDFSLHEILRRDHSHDKQQSPVFIMLYRVDLTLESWTIS